MQFFAFGERRILKWPGDPQARHGGHVAAGINLDRSDVFAAVAEGPCVGKVALGCCDKTEHMACVGRQVWPKRKGPGSTDDVSGRPQIKAAKLHWIRRIWTELGKRIDLAGSSA